MLLERCEMSSHTCVWIISGSILQNIHSNQIWSNEIEGLPLQACVFWPLPDRRHFVVTCLPQILTCISVPVLSRYPIFLAMDGNWKLFLLFLSNLITFIFAHTDAALDYKQMDTHASPMHIRTYDLIIYQFPVNISHPSRSLKPRYGNLKEELESPLLLGSRVLSIISRLASFICDALKIGSIADNLMFLRPRLELQYSTQLHSWHTQEPLVLDCERMMKEMTCWREEVGPPWIIAADWIAILGQPLSHLLVPWESGV